MQHAASHFVRGEMASRISPGSHHFLVEAAGQMFHLFRDGLDYAFILRRFRDEWDAGRVIRIVHPDPNPGAGSDARASQPVHESLHGKASWPHLTARRCHATLVAEGFTE
jgi:hypothetical protein